jgi:hypothetical protein
MAAHRRKRSRTSKIGAAAIGTIMAGAAAYAATNWVIGLTSGSNGEGKSMSITTLTIKAVSSPSAVNQMYPGSDGDVVVTITNSNTFPVTITAVNLPTETTYAAGFTTATLTTAKTGCSGSTSLVRWNYSSATTGSSHTLHAPITVAATGSVKVTFTNDAAMSTTSPSACENTYFSMPSLTGISATSANHGTTATSGTVTDYWSS